MLTAIIAIYRSILGRRPFSRACASKVRYGKAAAFADYSSSHHITLPESFTCGKRVIIVGDVHGCMEELDMLLEKIQFRRMPRGAESDAADILIQVGDVVNKGPGSLEALQFFMETANAYAIRGNHEDRALNAWKSVKKGKTVETKYEWVLTADDSAIDYMANLPYSLSLPAYGCMVVHAGIVPGRNLKMQDLNDLVLMRDLVFLKPVDRNGDDTRREQNRLGALADDVFGVGDEAQDTRAWTWENVIAAQEGKHDDKILLFIRGSERQQEGSVGWAEIYRGPPHIFFGEETSRMNNKWKRAIVDVGVILNALDIHSF